MKLKILVLAYLSLICGTAATIQNQTDDLVVLTKIGSPYKIHQDLVVDENQTLIIEPGVTLLFAPTKRFMIKGNLIAEGTNDERITLAPLENHSTKDHLTNYSLSRNLRFLNESGYPSGKLELFDSNKWHKVCLGSNLDKISQDYFVKSICSNFGYGKGRIKKGFSSAGFTIALISSCSPNRIQSFDFTDYCYLRTNLNGSFYSNRQECFEIECIDESSFVHNWGGLVIDSISESEKTSLSFVDINEAGYLSNGLDGFSLDLRGNNDFSIKNININRPASNGLIARQSNFVVENFNFTAVPLSAIYLSLPDSIADFRIKNSIFVNNTIGINVMDWIGNLSIHSNRFYLNEMAILYNHKSKLEWELEVKNCTFFRNKADFSLKTVPIRYNASSVLLFEKNFFLETEKESIHVYLEFVGRNFSKIFKISLVENYFEKINSKIFHLVLDNTFCHNRYYYYCMLLLDLNVLKNSFVSNNVNDVLYLDLRSVLDKNSSIVIENNDFINNRPKEKNNNPSILFRRVSSVINLKILWSKTTHQIGKKVQIKKNNFLNCKSIYEIAFEYFYDYYYDYYYYSGVNEGWANMIIDLSENYWNRTVDEIWLSIFDFHVDNQQPLVILNSIYTNSQRNILKKIDHLNDFANVNRKVNQIYSQIHGNVTLVSGVYYARQNVVVKKDSFLDIGPNVTILFSSSTRLIVEGKLNISGSLDQPVQFRPITTFNDLNKEKRLRLNNLRHLTEGSKITFSGRIESKIENKWYSLCADTSLNETYFGNMCQWMGFEQYVGYTVEKFNGSFVQNMTCSYNSLSSCSFEICHVDCECKNHVMLTCKSYSTQFGGIHLTQYARRSKINNLKLAGYGYGYVRNRFEAAIQIDYRNHELENIILETTQTNTIGVWFTDCPYEAISILNMTVLNSFVSVHLDNFRSNFTADGLFGNEVNILQDGASYYFFPYQNPLLFYDRICARLITIGNADTIQIFSNMPITSDCFFRIRAKDKGRFLLITDQLPNRWSFEQINELNQTINVSSWQGDKKIFLFPDQSNEILIRLRIKKPTYFTYSAYCRFRLELVDFGTIAEADRSKVFFKNSKISSSRRWNLGSYRTKLDFDFNSTEINGHVNVRGYSSRLIISNSIVNGTLDLVDFLSVDIINNTFLGRPTLTGLYLPQIWKKIKARIFVESCKFVNYSRALSFQKSNDYTLFLKISNNTFENSLEAVRISVSDGQKSTLIDSFMSIESNKFHNCLRAFYYQNTNYIEIYQFFVTISNNIFENSVDAIRVSVQNYGRRPSMVLGSVLSIESNSFHNCSRCIRNENYLRKTTINWYINDNKINNLFSNTTNSQLVSIHGNGTFQNNVITNLTMSNQASSLFSFKCSDTFLFKNNIYTSITTQTKFLIEITCEYGSMLQISSNQLLENQIEYVPEQCSLDSKPNAIFKLETLLNNLHIFNNTFKKINNSIEIVALISTGGFQLDDMAVYQTNQLIADFSSNNLNLDYYNHSRLKFNFYSKKFDFKLSHDNSSKAIGKTQFSYIIRDDTTWTINSSPYFLSENVVVLAFASLKIEAGVQINFLKNVTFYIFGKVLMIGTIHSPIYIKSLLPQNCLQNDALNGNLFYFLSQSNVSMLFNLMIEDSLIETNLDNKKISTLFVEDGYFPLIENLTINGCAYNGITVLKSLNNIVLKSVKIINCKGNATNLLNFDRNVLLENFMIEESQNRNFISIDNSLFNQYLKQSFSEKTLVCNEEIFLNETFKEYVFDRIVPWPNYRLDCSIKFKTSHDQVIHLAVYKFSEANDLKIKDKNSLEIEPFIGHYLNYPMASNLYASKYSELIFEISCKRFVMNELCIETGFLFKLNVLPKIFGLQTKEKLASFFNFDEKFNSSDWTFENDSNLLFFNYTQGMAHGDNYSQIIESQMLKKNSLSAILIKFKSLSYDFISNTEMLFFLIDNLNETSFLIDRQYMPFRLDNSKNHIRLIRLEKLSYVPDEFRLQIRFKQLNKAFGGIYDKTIYFVLESLLFLPMPQQISNTKIQIKNSIVKDIDINVNNDEYLAHCVDFEIEQSSFKSAKIRAPHSIINNFYVKNSYFVSQALSFDMELHYLALERDLLNRQQSPTNVTFEKCYFLSSIFNKFYIKGNLRGLINFVLVSSEFYENNLKKIEIESGNYEISANIFRQNRGHFKFQGCDGKLWSNLFKANNRYNCDYFIQSTHGTHHVFNNSFVNNECRKILNFYTYFYSSYHRYYLEYNWWDTTNITLISQMNQFRYQSIRFQNIQRKDPLLFRSELCAEGWLEWNNKCIKQINIPVSFVVGKRMCDLLDSNVVKYLEIEEFLLNYTENINQSFWYNSVFSSTGYQCTHLTYSHKNGSYELKNSSCEERKSVICDKPLCLNKKNCSNHGKCIDVDRCKCHIYSSGEACDEFYCDRNCNGNGKCIGPNNCKCDQYWSGSVCTVPLCPLVDSCTHWNRGRCIAPNKCRCWSGYTGSKCENFSCQYVCRNNGECIGPNKCKCISGWKGNMCTIPVCKFNCNNRGSCMRPDECRCYDNFNGKYCQHIDCSRMLNCSNNGYCIESDNQIKCQCDNSWTGQFCNQTIQNCDQFNNCNWKGKCVFGRCECDNGWTSHNCLQFTCTTECRNGARCIGPNKCLCETNWTGTDCNIPLCNHQTCPHTLDFTDDTWSHKSCVAVGLHSTFTTRLIVKSLNNHSYPSQISTEMPYAMTKSPLQKLDQKWMVLLEWRPFLWQTGIEKLCFSAIDNNKIPTPQSCISILLDVVDIVFLNSSATPKNEIKPRTKVEWSIKTNRLIFGPKYASYIRFFDSNGTQVLKVNTLKNQAVTIGEKELAFVTYFDWKEKESYHVEFDRGAVTASEHCRPESKPVRDKNFWSFQIKDVTPPVIQFVSYSSISRGQLYLEWTFDEPVTTVCTIYNFNINLKNVLDCSHNSLSVDTSNHLLNEGYYSLFIQATDVSGNILNAQHNWKVDFTPPQFYLRNWIKMSKQIGFDCYDRYNRYDRNCHFRCTLIFNSLIYIENNTACTSPFSVGHLQNGYYKFMVEPRDTAGNFGQIKSLNFLVDKNPPDIQLESEQITLESCSDTLGEHTPNVTDDYDANVELSFELVYFDNCTTTLKWIAKDSSGNVAEKNQTIEFSQKPRLNLLLFESFINVPCDKAEKQSYFNSYLNDHFRFDNECNRPLKFEYIDSIDQIKCGIEFNRTWRIEDDCENVIKRHQIIRVLEQKSPDSPPDGQLNSRRNSMLAWPKYPNSNNFMLNIWWIDENSKQEVKFLNDFATSSRSYSSIAWYPANTRVFWKIDYVIDSLNQSSGQELIPSPIWSFVTKSQPDLYAKQIFVPETAFSGQFLEVKWFVQNKGNVTTNTWWYDRVFKSRSLDFSSALLIKNVYQRRYVEPHNLDGYTSSLSIGLGDDELGNIYIFIQVDAFGNVDDFNRANNLQMSSAIQILQTPSPNLIVQDLFFLNSSFSGQIIEIRFKVKNIGFGVTKFAKWFDCVDLKKANSSQQTINLAFFEHNGKLSSGSFYQSIKRIQIPERLYGIYEIVVTCDCRKNIYEGSDQSDNSASKYIDLIIKPPADLSVDLNIVDQKEEYFTGDFVQVEVIIKNVGLGITLENNWYDSLAFRDSLNKVHQEKSWYHVGQLDAGSFYSYQHSFQLAPRLKNGIYHLEAKADSLMRVFELLPESKANNIKRVKFNLTRSLPDFVISYFSFEVDQTDTGSYLNVNYSITNNAQENILQNNFGYVDSFYFEKRNSSYLVKRYDQRVNINRNLGVWKQNETRKYWQTILLDDQIHGDQIYVCFNFDNWRSIVQSNYSNNFGRYLIANSLIKYKNSLKLLNFTVAQKESFYFNQIVSLEWHAINNGNKKISLNSIDYVYVALDRTFALKFNPRYRVAAKIKYHIDLKLNETYSKKIDIKIPSVEFFRQNRQAYFVVDIARNIFPLIVVSNTSDRALFKMFKVQPEPKAKFVAQELNFTLNAPKTAVYVTFRVKNEGNSMLTLSKWKDQILLEDSNGKVFLKQNIQVEDRLRSGDEYAVKRAIPMPKLANGIYNLFLVVDADNELTGDSDRFYAPEKIVVNVKKENPLNKISINVINVTDGNSLDKLISGSLVEVRYKVETEHLESDFKLNVWLNEIYILNIQTNNTEKIQFGKMLSRIELIQQINKNSTYFLKQSFEMPFYLNDNFFFYILMFQQDQKNTIVHASSKNSYQIVDGTRPDLVVSLVKTTDKKVDSGSELEIFFQISNKNGGILSEIKNWNDDVYLSEDSILDLYDVKLLSKNNLPTQTNNSDNHVLYSRHVKVSIPFDLNSQYYYIIVQTDSSKSVIEQDEENNLNSSLIYIQERPSSDLAIAFLNHTQKIEKENLAQLELSYALQNNGGKQVKSLIHCDSFYLSEDSVWDIYDYQLDAPKCTQKKNLKPFLNFSQNLLQLSSTQNVPLMKNGSFYCILKTRSNLRENNLQNNVKASNHKVQIFVPQIYLDQSIALNASQEKLFMIENVPSEQTLIIKLQISSNFKNNSNLPFHRLLIAYETAPSFAIYDAKSGPEQSAEQILILSKTKKGSYYVKVVSFSSEVSPRDFKIEILAKLAKFELTDSRPKKILANGVSTINIIGSNIPRSFTVCLKSNETFLSICSNRTKWISSTNVYVLMEFNQNQYFFDISTDFFDIVMYDRTNLSRSAQITQGIQLNQDLLPGILKYRARRQNGIPWGGVGQTIIETENIGFSDVHAPLLLMQCEKSLAKFKLNIPGFRWTNSFAFIGLSLSDMKSTYSAKTKSQMSFLVRQDEILSVGVDFKILPYKKSPFSNQNLVRNFFTKKKKYSPALLLNQTNTLDQITNNLLNLTNSLSTYENFEKSLSKLVNNLHIEQNVLPLEKFIDWTINLAQAKFINQLETYFFDDFDKIAYSTHPNVRLTRFFQMSMVKRRFLNDQLFGVGWQMNLLSIKLKNVSDTLVQMEYNSILFKCELKQSSCWLDQKRYFVASDDGPFFFYDIPNSLLYTFSNLSLNMEQIIDLNTNETTAHIEYHLQRIRLIIFKETSRKIQLNYDKKCAEQIESITLTNSINSQVVNKATYLYSQNCRHLLSAQSKNNRIDYSYDWQTDDLVSIDFSRKNVSIEFEFDSNSGHLHAKKTFHNTNKKILLNLVKYNLKDNGELVVTNANSLNDSSDTTIKFDLDGSITSIENNLNQFKSQRSAQFPNSKSTEIEKFYYNDKMVMETTNSNNELSITTETQATTRIQFNPAPLFSLRKFIDANNNEYEFVYSSESGRKKIQLMWPDRGHETFEFDAKSRMIDFVRRDRKTEIKYDYNSFDSVSGIEISGEHENFKRKYFYEQDSNFKQLKSILSDRKGNAAEEILFFYESDCSENPSKIVYPNGIELNYEYNSMDQRTKFYTNQGYSISYHYNQKFELVSVVDNVANEEIVQFEYDSNSRLVKQMYSNGIYSLYTWNEHDKIKSVTHYYKNGSISNKIQVFYDNYNRHRVTSKLSGECNLRYDAGDQITAHECNGRKISIEYDRLGNRKFLSIENKSSPNTSLRFNYLINSLNQYLSVKSSEDSLTSLEMKYDQNGNLIWYQNERLDQDRIEYNYANKPIRVVTLNVICNYSYDDMDNLESKQCSDGSRVEYVVDPYAHYGPNVIGETQYFKDGTNRSIKYYHALWNGLISMQHKDNLSPGQARNKKYFFQYDENWSTNLVSDENSHIISEYSYDPFGSILKSFSQINLNNSFLYQSFYGIMRLNELNDVYYFRNRLYKSEIARFLNLDPYSILSSTNNLYDYCNNNPFIYIDTLGQRADLRELAQLEAIKAAGQVTGGFVGQKIGEKIGRYLGMVLGIPFGLKGVLIGNVAGAKLGKFIGKRVGEELGNYWAEYLYNRARRLDEIENENGVENEEEMENVSEEDGIEWTEVWPFSKDPNDIIGPEGFGPLKRIHPADTLSYKIRFENLMNSTAPAQYVFIKLLVNKNLDLRTFELDEFSFANKNYSIEQANSYYQQKIDIDAYNTTNKLDDFQMVMRVQAGLDILSKSAFWKLEALDKNTGAPPTDKTIGFLPPNDNSTHIGEGYVKFKIQPSKTAANMARIDANASIVFDINDPIITPNIFNTIDADAPQIHVEIDPNSENFGTAELIHLDMDDAADFDKLYVYEHRQIFDQLNNRTISESIRLIEQSKGKSIALELDQRLSPINSRSSQLLEKVKWKIYSTDHIGNVRKLKEIPLQLNSPVCDQSNCFNGICSSTGNCVCDLDFIGTDCTQRQNLSTLEPPIVEFFLVNQSDMDQSMKLFVNCIGIDDNANLTLLLYLSSNSSLKEKSLIIEQVELDGRKYHSLNIDILYSEIHKNLLTVLSDSENNKTMLELVCSQSSSGVLANQSIALEVVHSIKLGPHLLIDSNLTCFPADSDIIRIQYSILNQEPESNFRIYILNLNNGFKWQVDYLNRFILIEKDQTSFEDTIDLDIKMVATKNGNIFAQVDRKISFCETQSSNSIFRILYSILKYFISFLKYFF